jgi:hypothetical protein
MMILIHRACVRYHAGEKTVFLSHLCIKTMILPRQARDKHKGKLKKSPFPRRFNLIYTYNLMVQYNSAAKPASRPGCWTYSDMLEVGAEERPPLSFRVFSFHVCPESVWTNEHFHLLSI